MKVLISGGTGFIGSRLALRCLSRGDAVTVLSGGGNAARAAAIVTSWLIARGLGVEVSLLFIVGAVPLVGLISRIPITIGGLGVYDGVFMLVMSMAGLTAAESIAIALASRILETAAWFPWWLVHVIGYGEFRPFSLEPKGS